MTGVFTGLPPVSQALLATLFTWGMTAAGAALVFGAKNVNKKLLDAMLAFLVAGFVVENFSAQGPKLPTTRPD